MCRQALSFLLLASTCVVAAFSSHGRFFSAGKRSALSMVSSNDNSATELTSTLARLDQQWKIQQMNKPQSRWTKLVLKSEAGSSTDDGVTEEPLTSLMAQEEDAVYLLEPPNKAMPSCLIAFTGGAGLGQFPQVAYNELLTRVSDRLNAAVIAAPYSVGLDHFALAKETGEKIRRAVLHCQDDPAYGYPESLPTYCLAHSLGCKLATIYMAATDLEFAGTGFMGFNNFSFGQTIGMAKQFADTLRKNMGVPDQSSPFGSSVKTDEVLNQVFSFAETAVSAIGIEFTPTPVEMEHLIAMKYDEGRQKKTRMFTFDDDVLENTEQFVNACAGNGPDVSELHGTHLAPVYFKLGLDQIPDEVARDMAREAVGGIESASFGNEEELNALVDEVCDWILGKGPSRPPSWQREPPLIAGTSTTDGENP